jgi:probable HAF family extracellular repeat protein
MLSRSWMEVDMNWTRFLVLGVAALFLTAFSLPVQLAAQYPQYKLIDIGTFGGPNDGVNGPNVPILSNDGIYGGESELNIPDPFAPTFCQDPDCLVQHAQKWSSGVMTDLGTLPGVNLSSGATWVSANATIVGSSENGLTDPLLGVPEIRAVLWTKEGKIIDLGTLEGGYESFATAVNDGKQVAGFSLNTIPDPFSMNPCAIYGICEPNFTQTRGFIWEHGAMQDLGTLGGPDTFPEAMNDHGQIVGWSYTNSTPNANGGFACPPGVPTQDPFFWDKGKLVDIGTFGGTCGQAIFINNRGQVVGTSNLAGNQATHAFLWESGTLKDIGTLGGVNAQADWISDSGLIVGRADVSMQNTIHHAFLWKNGAMTDLGVLDPWPCSTALSVNSKGQVIGDTGICNVGGGPNFYSQDGQPMVDINTLVLPGSDLQILDLFSINERGEIAGGALTPDGDEHAIVLIPASANEIAAAKASNMSVLSSRNARRTIRDPNAPLLPGQDTVLNRLGESRRLP